MTGGIMQLVAKGVENLYLYHTYDDPSFVVNTLIYILLTYTILVINNYMWNYNIV